MQLRSALHAKEMFLGKNVRSGILQLGSSPVQFSPEWNRIPSLKVFVAQSECKLVVFENNNFVLFSCDFSARNDAVKIIVVPAESESHFVAVNCIIWPRLQRFG